jgi:hydrogenase maturation protein HypF
MPLPQIAATFHHTLVEIMTAIARKVRLKQIVLSGGCFQNTYLLEGAIQRLKAEDFVPCWPQRIPPNDGGLALGQILASLRAIQSQGMGPVFIPISLNR